MADGNTGPAVAWSRLRERKVVQWTLAYVAVAWVLFQAISQLAQNFGWPIWIPRVATVALALGVLPAAIVAWFHGEKGAQRVSGIESAVLAITLIAIGGGLWSYGTRIASEAPPTTATAPTSGPSIAVLPFASLSDAQDDAYFADGMQDELISRLATLRGVTVVSRSSTLAYRASTKPLRQVAAELGVAMLVEATVRRANGRVRVTAKLIDAAKDAPVWAQSFEREAKDTFRVQADVARLVAESIGHQMDGAEGAALDRVLSSDPEAIDLYFQGLQHHDLAFEPHCCDPQEFERSRAAFERAIARDSGFALAYARLANMLSEYYIQSGPDYPPELAEAARRNAAEALRLAPDSAESQLAVGLVRYNVEREIRSALEPLRLAATLAPSDAPAHMWLGFCLRRAGRFDEAIAAFERARRIAANGAEYSGLIDRNRIDTLRTMRRPNQALAVLDEMIAAAPTDEKLRVRRALILSDLFGADGPRAQYYAEHPDGPPERDPAELVAAGRAKEVLAAADAMTARCSRIVPVPCFDGGGSWPQPYFRALALRELGRLDESRAAGKAAMRFYEQLLADPAAPGGARGVRLHGQLAMAAALAGDAATARAEIEPWLAAEDDPGFEDPFTLTVSRHIPLMALSGSGDLDRAFAYMRRMLSEPGEETPFTLQRVGPARYPEMYADPRWQETIDEFARKAPPPPPDPR